MTAPSRVERVALIDKCVDAIITESRGCSLDEFRDSGARATWARDVKAVLAASDAALEEAGYAIVLREPTAEMIQAGGDVMLRTTRPLNNAIDGWRAMWDAAPKPEAE